MKRHWIPWPLLLVMAALHDGAFAQGTAFTYQGRLNIGNGPANGSYDLIFTLYSTNVTGIPIAGPVTNQDVPVTNGLFFTSVDFGLPPVGGTNWLEIAVSTNQANAFTTLTPRQTLTPVPYALVADTLAGPLNISNLPATVVTDGANGLTLNGTFTGDGSGLTNISAGSLNGFTANSFWGTGGNTGANPTNGAFMGTTDPLPLELRVNGNRALRLESVLDTNMGTPAINVMGGSVWNVVYNGAVGAFIGGGGNSSYPNRVGGNYATVVGGLGNRAGGQYSTAMGNATSALGVNSTTMGNGSTAYGTNSVAMGNNTFVTGANSVAMGDTTSAAGADSVAMGYNSTAAGAYSAVMGYDTYAGSSYATAMGYHANADGLASTAMGYGTTASGPYSVTMGTETVANGQSSLVTGVYSSANGDYDVSLGYFTVANGFASMALGAAANITNDDCFVWSDGATVYSTAPNQFLVHATGGLQVFGGGLAVSGTSSPNYKGAKGVFIESEGTFGAVYGFDYVGGHTLPLCLNTPGGNVGIGTTTPDATLTVNGSADKPGGGSWNTYSDGRLKDVGTVFTSGLAALETLQPVRYHYKSGNPLQLPSQPEYIGVVAQQVKAAVPDAVQASPSGYLTVNNDPILWTTVNAVKELSQSNQKLAAENAELKDRLTRLEQLVQQLRAAQKN